MRELEEDEDAIGTEAMLIDYVDYSEGLTTYVADCIKHDLWEVRRMYKVHGL